MARTHSTSPDKAANPAVAKIQHLARCPAVVGGAGGGLLNFK